MVKKTAVITGVSGQDGSFLAEYLLSMDYNVVGISRRSSTSNNDTNIAIAKKNKNFTLIKGDLRDSTCISRIIFDYSPHEFYNLGAQSHVGHSFDNPIESFRCNAEPVFMHLNLIRSMSPSTRYYQASTSEILGGLDCPPDGYSEQFVPNPRSPYAVSKMSAHYAVKNFRESYGMYAVSGILFNHSSPRRGLDFATRKITRGLARVLLGKESCLKMGNLSAFRDEGHSKDYVKAMWMMLNQDLIANKDPEDYVVSTGLGATIEDMFKHVCSIANLKFNDVYRLDERFIRPSEVMYLKGNSDKIKSDLGWLPKYSWKSLLEEMFENDVSLEKEGE